MGVNMGVNGPLTLVQAAAQLGLSPAAVRMRYRRKKLKGFQKDGRLFILLSGEGEQGGEQGPNRGEPPLRGTDTALFSTEAPEVARLVAENATLNRRLDSVLQLLEREQVLRQQMQGQITALTERLALPPPSAPSPEIQQRLALAEQNVSLLKRGIVALITFLEKSRKP